MVAKVERVTPLQQRLSKQNRARFEEIYRNHFSAVCRFLERLGLSADSARDLAHDAYLRVVRQNALDRLQQAPQAYLCQVAFNLLRDQKRLKEHRTGSQHVEFVDEKAISPMQSPEISVIQRQRLERLKQALMKLSSKQRKVLLLQRFDGLTCQEISEQLGLSLRSVQRYLSEALRYCETVMDIKES